MAKKENEKYIYLDEKNIQRTFDFCMDELNYHIYESGCAWEYHDENMVELEILCQLGVNGSEYLSDYLEYLQEKHEDIRYGSPSDRDFLKTLKNYIREVKEYQEVLKRVFQN